MGAEYWVSFEFVKTLSVRIQFYCFVVNYGKTKTLNVMENLAKNIEVLKKKPNMTTFYVTIWLPKDAMLCKGAVALMKNILY